MSLLRRDARDGGHRSRVHFVDGKGAEVAADRWFASGHVVHGTETRVVLRDISYTALAADAGGFDGGAALVRAARDAGAVRPGQPDDHGSLVLAPEVTAPEMIAAAETSGGMVNAAAVRSVLLDVETSI